MSNFNLFFLCSGNTIEVCNVRLGWPAATKNPQSLIALVKSGYLISRPLNNDYCRRKAKEKIKRRGVSEQQS